MRMTLRAAAIGAALALWASPAFAQETQTPGPPAETAQPAPETTPAPEAAPPAVATPAPVSETTTEHYGPPSSGKGRIVFYRPNRFTGGGIFFTVRQGEEVIGRLPNARYWALEVDPGIHEYNIRGGENIRIEVEEGETYYLQLNVAMGMMSGRGVFAPATKAQFEEAEARMQRRPPLMD